MMLSRLALLGVIKCLEEEESGRELNTRSGSQAGGIGARQEDKKGVEEVKEVKGGDSHRRVGSGRVRNAIRI
jgi:hypothetical protein